MIIWTALGIMAFFVIMNCIAVSGSYSNFKSLPPSLSGKKATIPYLRVRMKYKDWRRLFELDPSRFLFILKNGCQIGLGTMLEPFREAHPTYGTEDAKKFYVVDFNYVDWLKYAWYCRKIMYRISNSREQEMTEAIVGDLQAKINAIVEESEKHIQQTLDLQQKIIDRMSEENDNTTVCLH